MPEQTENEAELIVTRDGSHTVYSSRFDQHYHNPNGAVAESRYVFFEQTGLLDALDERSQITILEIGFGTGLNLLLLLDYYLDHNSQAKINYYSIEGFPLLTGKAQNLNFGNHINHPKLASEVISVFNNLSEGINHFSISGISVQLFNGMFEDFNFNGIDANYIFHDAFSPEVNPDLWTGSVFKKLTRLSADDVILSTYCAASKARGAMASAGWKIARARGALGKREMTLAALDTNRLGNLKRVNEERLARRYEEDDF